MDNKKVTICASESFLEESVKWKRKLEDLGYKVVQIPEILNGNYLDVHKKHYQSIGSSDIVFVLNIPKNGIEGYIGPSVFAEIAFAIGLNHVLDKNIEVFCLNEIPKGLPYTQELLLWGKAGWIKKWSQ